jgi:hypothetical protein
LETKLQLAITEALSKEGIRVINGVLLDSKPLGKVVEVDQVLPDYGIIFEYWHSEDQRYRATRKGTLRIPRLKKDIAKTIWLQSLGWFPLWIDQADINPNSHVHVQVLTQWILNLCRCRRFSPTELDMKPLPILSPKPKVSND